MTFGTIIVGPSNRIAVELVQRAIGDSRHRPSPVLLVGRSGCGKTQLLHAAANELLRDSRSRVVMRTAAEVADGFIDAIKAGSVDAYWRAITDADALLVDGLEDLRSRPATLEVLGARIEAMAKRRKPVVLTATTFAGLGSLSLQRGQIESLGLPTLDERVLELQRTLEARQAQLSTRRLATIAARARTFAEARSILYRVLELQGLAARHRRMKGGSRGCNEPGQLSGMRTLVKSAGT